MTISSLSIPQFTPAIRLKTLSEEEDERVLNGTSGKCLETRTNSAISRAFSIPPPLPGDSTELSSDIVILNDDPSLSEILKERGFEFAAPQFELLRSDAHTQKADPIPCKNLFKKVAHSVKKTVKKVKEFVKEHPVLTAVIVAAGVLGIAAVITIAQRKEEEEKEDNPSTPPSGNGEPPKTDLFDQAVSSLILDHKNDDKLTSETSQELKSVSEPRYSTTIQNNLSPEGKRYSETDFRTSFANTSFINPPFDIGNITSNDSSSKNSEEIAEPKNSNDQYPFVRTPFDFGYTTPIFPSITSDSKETDNAKIPLEVTGSGWTRDENGKYCFQELLIEAPYCVPTLFNRGEIQPETFIHPLPASQPPPALPENHRYAGNLDLIFINGILNGQESGIEGAKYVQKLAGGPPITFVHLPSFGFSYDIGLSNTARDGGAINSTALALEQVLYSSLEKSKPNDKILIVCHSAGAINTDAIVKRIPEEYHSRFIIIAIAPGKFILDGNYEHANLMSEGGSDPVVLWQYERRKIAEEQGNVIAIPKHPKGGIILHLWVDHELQSPTFQEYLKQVLKESTGKYNAWAE